MTWSLCWMLCFKHLVDIRPHNPSNIFPCKRLVYTWYVTEYSLAKTAEYVRVFPNFQNCACCEKDLKDNKPNGHLTPKYAQIFVLGQYLFLSGHSFSRATISENCPLLETDYVCYKRDLKDNKHYSLHLLWNYAQIFVLGHYLFLEAHSFPRAMLSENCSLLRTDNVRGQISKHIFTADGGYMLVSHGKSLRPDPSPKFPHFTPPPVFPNLLNPPPPIDRKKFFLGS